jgi:hypothetical protein
MVAFDILHMDGCHVWRMSTNEIYCLIIDKIKVPYIMIKYFSTWICCYLVGLLHNTHHNGNHAGKFLVYLLRLVEGFLFIIKFPKLAVALETLWRMEEKTSKRKSFISFDSTKTIRENKQYRDNFFREPFWDFRMKFVNNWIINNLEFTGWAKIAIPMCT